MTRQDGGRNEGPASENSNARGSRSYFHVRDLDLLRGLVAAVIERELDGLADAGPLDLLGEIG
jgi:hypothetical protein